MSEKTVVRTESAPAPFQGAPYSQAIVANGFVFVAGQVGLQPDHTELVGDGIVEQTEQAFDNLAAILEEAGSALDRVVKTTRGGSASGWCATPPCGLTLLHRK